MWSTVLSRSETVARLRALAKLQATVTLGWLRDHDRALLRGALVHFESISAARRAAGMKDPVFPRKWTVARIVEHLRAAYDAGNSTRIADLRDAGYGPLVSAIARHVRGIRRARLLAQVPEPKPVRGEREPWDELRVVIEILDLWRRGVSVALSKAPRKLVHAGTRIFESWAAAIEAAGLDYDRIRLVRAPYTEDEIIALLHRLARERPDMSWSDLHAHKTWNAMQRHFGSVHEAVTAAGLDGWPSRRQVDWSRDRVLRELKLRARTHPRAPIPAGLETAARTYFGSVSTARAAAGLPELRVRWTKQRVIDELRAQAPNGERVTKTLSAACCRQFGSIHAARRAAGIASRPTKWSRDRVLAILREKAARRDLTIRGTLGHACVRYFGSWSAARKAAGLASPRTPMTAWSRDAVLAALRKRVLAERPIGTSLKKACRHHFGSIPAARVAAGLRPTRSIWTKPGILEALRKLDGKSVYQADRSLVAACLKHFGSVDGARVAAGLPSREHRRWTPEIIVRGLRAWSRDGQPAIESGLAAAARRHFGSLEVACEAAGVLLRVQRWTRERVVAAIKDAARSDGRLPTRVALACRRHFGTIAAARAAAGVPALSQRWTRAMVIEQLRDRDRRGLVGVDSRLQFACHRYFGTVAAAKRAAGVAPAQRTWTRQTVIQEIRRRWSDRNLTDGGLGNACRRIFGSIDTARVAAGLAPLQRRWTRADLIAEVRRHADVPLPNTIAQACIKQFGSTNAARIAAGVPLLRTEWTPESVLTAVRRADRGGGPLDGKLRAACRQHFGSVEDARAAVRV